MGNYLITKIGQDSVEDRLRFVIGFAFTDLGSFSQKELNLLRRRFAEFLGYVEVEYETPIGTQTGYPGVQEATGIDVIFDRREPEDFALTDFVGLQEKIKPILKATSQKVNTIGFAETTFPNLRFSVMSGSFTIHAADPQEAFLITYFLLISRWKYAKRICDCVYCETPFFKNKRQTYCQSCKTRADRERVRRWRKQRTKFVKEEARAARRRLKNINT